MQPLGIACDFVDEPYAAMGELCKRAQEYGVIVLSLQGIYDEELTLIPAVKRRFPQMQVYLAHTDGRQSAMAEGLRLGAAGLLTDQSLHPLVSPVVPAENPPPPPPAAAAVTRLDLSSSEPLLTAEELRALLDDEPLVSGGEK